jgi:hypothetical protein
MCLGRAVFSISRPVICNMTFRILELSLWLQISWLVLYLPIIPPQHCLSPYTQHLHAKAWKHVGLVFISTVCRGRLLCIMPYIYFSTQYNMLKCRVVYPFVSGLITGSEWDTSWWAGSLWLKKSQAVTSCTGGSVCVLKMFAVKPCLFSVILE